MVFDVQSDDIYATLRNRLRSRLIDKCFEDDYYGIYGRDPF